MAGETINQSERLLTVADAAAILRCSNRHVKRLCESGRIQATDIGSGEQRLWRIRADALDAIAPRQPIRHGAVRGKIAPRPYRPKFAWPS